MQRTRGDPNSKKKRRNKWVNTKARNNWTKIFTHTYIQNDVRGGSKGDSSLHRRSKKTRGDTSENHTNPEPAAVARLSSCGEGRLGQKTQGQASWQTDRGRDREIRIMNMRNLDNQMMLYFSDKSLIFNLYYYILLWMEQNKKQTTETNKERREHFLIEHSHLQHTNTHTSQWKQRQRGATQNNSKYPASDADYPAKASK